MCDYFLTHDFLQNLINFERDIKKSFNFRKPVAKKVANKLEKFDWLILLISLKKITTNVRLLFNA